MENDIYDNASILGGRDLSRLEALISARKSIDDINEELLTGTYSSDQLQLAASIAAQMNNLEVLSALSNNGAKLDKIPQGNDEDEGTLSPLGRVAFTNHEEAVEKFGDQYDVQPAINEALNYSLSALGEPANTQEMVTAHQKLDDILKTKIESLVENGNATILNPDSELMQNALRGIAKNGHADTLELLAKHKIIDLDKKDENGQSLRDIMNKGKDAPPTPSNGFDQENFDARLQQLQDESGRTWTHRGGVANYVFTEAPDAKTAAQLSHDLNNAGVHSVFSGDDIEKGKIIVAIPADELATLDASRTTNAAAATKNLLGTVDDSFTAEPPLDTGWIEPQKPQGLTR